MAGLKVSGSSQCHVYCWTLRDDSSGRMMANLEMTDITVRWSGLMLRVSAQVWTIRVDIHVLNHDGNLVDCCSVSSIAALAHFR